MKMKNVDNGVEIFDKAILNSLSFLDCKNVYISIVFILFLYNSCLFSNINNFVSDLYRHAFVKIIMLLVIIYVSRKSPLIGILLAISYVLSLNYKSIMETFISGYSGDNNFATVDNKTNSMMVGDKVEHMNHRNNRHMMNHRNIRHMMDEEGNNRHMMDDEGNNRHMMDDEERNNTNMNFEKVKHMNHIDKENNMMDKSENFQNQTNDCMNNYTHKYETLSDVCTPVSTFKNSLDAQGLNLVQGYEKDIEYKI